MAVKDGRDPGQSVLIVILGLSYANLLVKGWLYIFAATVQIGTELWPLIEPAIQLARNSPSN